MKFAFILALCMTSPAFAESGIVRVPCGYQQITLTTSAATLTVPTGCNASAAQIKVETQAIRYRDDSVAPTASIGMPLAVGEPGILYEGNPGNIQVFPQTSGAVVDVLYYQ